MSGVITWRWDSDGFGRVKPNKDPDGDGKKVSIQLRFPGQYEDETGLYYNWNRYYDPKLGRYITSDPIGLGGGLNTFGYVTGNPVRHSDVTGLKITGEWVSIIPEQTFTGYDMVGGVWN